MVDRHGGGSVRNIERRLREEPPQAGGHESADDATPPSVVASRITARAILPAVLAVPCAAHAAAAGVRCFAHGVCGERVARRSLS